MTLPPARPSLANEARTGAQQLSVGDIATLAVQVLPAPALSEHQCTMCSTPVLPAHLNCWKYMYMCVHHTDVCNLWLQVHSLLPHPVLLHSLSLRLMLLQETSGACCASLRDTHHTLRG